MRNLYRATALAAAFIPGLIGADYHFAPEAAHHQIAWWLLEDGETSTVAPILGWGDVSPGVSLAWDGASAPTLSGPLSMTSQGYGDHLFKKRGHHMSFLLGNRLKLEPDHRLAFSVRLLSLGTEMQRTDLTRIEQFSVPCTAEVRVFEHVSTVTGACYLNREKSPAGERLLASIRLLVPGDFGKAKIRKTEDKPITSINVRLHLVAQRR